MPLHIPLPWVRVYDYSGTEVVHSHDAAVSEVDGAYLKKKEIEVGWLFGYDRVKVAFDLKSGYAGVPVYARLYVNDAIKGVLQVESGTSYVTKTETLTDLMDLDKIALYLRGMPASNLIAGYGDRYDPEEITVYGGIIDGVFDVLEDISGWYLTGLAFDGTNLISCRRKDDNSDAEIFIHDGISSTILSNFGAFSNYLHGLTVAEGDLVETDTWTGAISVRDGFSFIRKGYFASPGGSPFGLTFDGANLISSDQGTDLIYVHVGVTEAISRSFAAPSGLIADLAFDGINLISADFDAGKIYVHDGVSSSILRSYDYASPSKYGGLTTYGYPDGAATGHAKNLRILGEIAPMSEKSAVFENIL